MVILCDCCTFSNRHPLRLIIRLFECLWHLLFRISVSWLCFKPWTSTKHVRCLATCYNPPSYLIGRHVFFSRNLSGLSDGAVISLTLVTIDVVCFNSLCWHTGCPRRNVRDFGRVFLMLNYTDITQNTYVHSRTVTEIMAREKCGRHRCRNTVRRPWRHTCPMRLPEQRDMVMQWPWRVRYSTVAVTSQDNRSAAACVKYLEV